MFAYVSRVPTLGAYSSKEKKIEMNDRGAWNCLHNLIGIGCIATGGHFNSNLRGEKKRMVWRICGVLRMQFRSNPNPNHRPCVCRHAYALCNQCIRERARESKRHPGYAFQMKTTQSSRRGGKWWNDMKVIRVYRTDLCHGCLTCASESRQLSPPNQILVNI